MLNKQYSKLLFNHVHLYLERKIKLTIDENEGGTFKSILKYNAYNLQEGIGLRRVHMRAIKSPVTFIGFPPTGDRLGEDTNQFAANVLSQTWGGRPYFSLTFSQRMEPARLVQG